MPATVTGTGLFTGAPGAVRITPADHRLAIVWAVGERTPADARAVAPPPSLPAGGFPARNTILSGGAGRTLLTVEHMLSALAGLGVWRAAIEPTGPEVPIGDGSAVEFVRALREAGIAGSGSGEVEPIVLREAIVIEDGKGGRIEAHPRRSPGATYEYRLDYGPGAPIAAQSAAWAPAGESEHGHGPGTRVYRDYATEVAPARTFCLQAEAEAMRAMGLFKHISPREMLVIGPGGPIENELRFEDEPARHKVLDIVGDLALAGGPIRADIVATRAGHALNHRLARAILESAAGYDPK
ncbi:MAG: UDP-3-O-acyl-N-acetylglucosamine deacetylase [Phycisphaerae bacterium]|nr:UDP-3-O-acyl-N-acetylglucosamine deacetylase [Phycisphaerae bacterium]